MNIDPVLFSGKAYLIEFATISLAPPPSWDELDSALKSIDAYDWLLFTSINAIKFFFSRLLELGLDSRALSGLRIAAVGSATSNELQKYGLCADLLPESEYTGAGLSEALLKQGVDGKRFLLPRALTASDVLPDTLNDAGGEVVIAPVYQNVRPSGHEEELRQYFLDNSVDMVTYTSSSTFTNFMFMLNPKDDSEMNQLLGGVDIASIGPITGKAITDNGVEVNVQPQDSYTIASLVEQIVSHYSK